MKLKKRNSIITILFLSVFVLTAFVARDYLMALVKSKSHFIKHPASQGVFFEPDAEIYADLHWRLVSTPKSHGIQQRSMFPLSVLQTRQLLLVRCLGVLERLLLQGLSYRILYMKVQRCLQELLPRSTPHPIQSAPPLWSTQITRVGQFPLRFSSR